MSSGCGRFYKEAYNGVFVCRHGIDDPLLFSPKTSPVSHRWLTGDDSAFFNDMVLPQQCDALLADADRFGRICFTPVYEITPQALCPCNGQQDRMLFGKGKLRFQISAAGKQTMPDAGTVPALLLCRHRRERHVSVQPAGEHVLQQRLFVHVNFRKRSGDLPQRQIFLRNAKQRSSKRLNVH